MTVLLRSRERKRQPTAVYPKQNAFFVPNQERVAKTCDTVSCGLETVARRADESDLLILGVQRHGRRKKLFGGFTRQIARRTSCPIIVMSRRG